MRLPIARTVDGRSARMAGRPSGIVNTTEKPAACSGDWNSFNACCASVLASSASNEYASVMLDKGNTTNTHHGRGYDCAQACAREGFQVGLLAVDGKVYEVGGGLAANKNAKLVPHLGHTVSITGALQEKDGLSVISSDALRMGTESVSTR